FKGVKSSRGLFFTHESIEAWDNNTVLSEEKSSLGFYLTGHPMKPLRPVLNKINVSTIADIFDTDEEDFVNNNEETHEIKIAGIVEEVKSKAKEKGVTAYITIEDETGRVEVVIYPELFKKCSNILTEKSAILIKGIIFKYPDSTKFLAREIEDLRNVDLKIKYEISIDCSDTEKASRILKEVRQCLEERHNGEGNIYICLNLPDYHVIILSPFEPCIDFETKIQKIKDCQVRIR
ncbi:DNA polymerase III subunit alpha, partial [Candidatus Aerophobetes bacterium]|nr:DNA polymerase III subunit alpha [Candidatus Aerophobetes bacterium]